MAAATTPKPLEAVCSVSFDRLPWFVEIGQPANVMDFHLVGRAAQFTGVGQKLCEQLAPGPLSLGRDKHAGEDGLGLMMQ